MPMSEQMAMADRWLAALEARNRSASGSVVRAGATVPVGWALIVGITTSR
jgi:hypothetical protein